MKKLQTEQVCSKVHLVVRRCKTKGKTDTARYILKDNMGESLVRLDKGYRIFQTIQSSPQYWENQKRCICHDKTDWFAQIFPVFERK